MKRRTVLATLAWAPWVMPRLTAQEHHAATANSRAGLAMGASMAPDGSLWIVALNEERRLFIQRSSDGGATWSNPRIVATGRDAIAADGENRPKLRFGPNGWAVISYTQPLAKPFSGEIRMLRSSDGGASFSAPSTVHRDRQVITHRFESIAFDASGALHVLWLDKRDLEAARRSNEKADYIGAALYRNVSYDGGRTFGPDCKVADHTCECCRIALVDDGRGGLAAMWRHVFAGGVRDHAFARIASGGERAGAIVRATFDEWRIDACPHHGPALALAANGEYHAVWFGVRDGEPAVRYARLGVDGESHEPARVIPDANAEHATVCSSGSNVAIVWRSFDGERTRYCAWVSRDEGRSFEQKLLGVTDAEADHPLLVRGDGKILALWRTRAEIRAVRVVG